MKGYHKLEFSADEIFYLNTSFRTGVRQFYNIINAGVKPSTLKEDQTYWTFGYGLGTAPRLAKWLSLNVDITSNHIMYERRINAINLLNKIYLGLDFHATKNLSVFFGGTINGYLTKTNYDGYPPLFTDYQPKIFVDQNFHNTNLKMWVGGKVGVRFL
jgi:hypothetical protein